MKRVLNFALVAFVMAQASFVFSEEDEVGASMTLHCAYVSQRTPQNSETASISETTAEDDGESAGIHDFKQGERHQSVDFEVKVGEFAECGFPSGNRVRVKVGEYPGSPYGQCGGGGEVFASVWINGRKLASRVWFAGHCIERERIPAPSFKFEGGLSDPRLQKCSTARLVSEQVEGDKSTVDKSVKDPLTVCLDFPEINRYSIDPLEYPPPGKNLPAADTVELMNGSGEVCDAAMKELRADFDTFGRYANKEAMQLKRPDWGKPSAALPDHVNEVNESIFDYDNDGNLDSVLRGDSETHYMDAVDLSVRFGRSSTRLDIDDAPADTDTMLIPCQMDSVPHKINDCPPTSQIADEAGFEMKWANERESVFFRARYSMVAPFALHGSNYIGVIGEGEMKDFVAIVQPMPKRTFKAMCLFRRVIENF